MVYLFNKKRPFIPILTSKQTPAITTPPLVEINIHIQRKQVKKTFLCSSPESAISLSVMPQSRWGEAQHKIEGKKEQALPLTKKKKQSTRDERTSFEALISKENK